MQEAARAGSWVENNRRISHLAKGRMQEPEYHCITVFIIPDVKQIHLNILARFQ